MHYTITKKVIYIIFIFYCPMQKFVSNELNNIQIMLIACLQFAFRDKQRGRYVLKKSLFYNYIFKTKFY